MQQMPPNTAPRRGIYDVHPNSRRAPGQGWESSRFQAVSWLKRVPLKRSSLVPPSREECSPLGGSKNIEVIRLRDVNDTHIRISQFNIKETFYVQRGSFL